jgi:uncharacterized membrane protein YfcA
MTDLLLYAVTLIASLLTLITGFGLATLLTPVFTLVYDVKIAVMLVAIVHFLNNILKLILFRRHVERSIVLRFGVLSIAGALAGAYLQLALETGVVKSILGIVLVLLGLGELLPRGLRFRLPQRFDYLGGLFSGFLGGLVGNQGAVRSAYLLNYAISKEAFIATGTVIALLIDATRLPVYVGYQFKDLLALGSQLPIVVAIAMAGTLAGKRLLVAVSPDAFRQMVAVFVCVIGLLFALRVL